MKINFKAYNVGAAHIWGPEIDFHMDREVNLANYY